jgi:hypothetical protein
VVEQSANYQDFLVLVPCCAVLLFVALAVGGLLFVVNAMGTPQQRK